MVRLSEIVIAHINERYLKCQHISRSSAGSADLRENTYGVAFCSKYWPITCTRAGRKGSTLRNEGRPAGSINSQGQVWQLPVRRRDQGEVSMGSCRIWIRLGRTDSAELVLSEQQVGGSNRWYDFYPGTTVIFLKVSASTSPPQLVKNAGNHVTVDAARFPVCASGGAPQVSCKEVLIASCTSG